MNTKRELFFHRTVRLLFVILCVRLFPRAGVLAAEFLSNKTPQWLNSLVNYGLPLILTLSVMLLLSRSFSLRDLGFNLNHTRWSLGASGIGIMVAAGLAFIWVSLSSSISFPDHSSAAILLSVKPVSQELLYRAFVLGVLHPVFPAMRPLFGKGISAAGLISALIFALSVLTIGFQPFFISLGDPLLSLIMLALGVGYAVMFEYTHSLLAPVLTHAAFQGAVLLAVYILR